MVTASRPPPESDAGGNVPAAPEFYVVSGGMLPSWAPRRLHSSREGGFQGRVNESRWSRGGGRGAVGLSVLEPGLFAPCTLRC